ncbi:L-alanine exporter AlaE [Vibrio aerogenes CECT 7868]|uniref:L-alanine exporter AlaE n=1 Tax=Vibrio aerogenes CECT 7868 TaxID=1216006 RepID=A0A1M5X8P6_9VIBR|nr:L-alanine exporter AlaE [Vibrio aerogenes]SHH96161.1 L-alanine exporter AlaE [Vibrio aerogenes CECT 7868]
MNAPFGIRHAAADTFAMVIFCFLTGMCIEVFISGMTLEQSLASRLLSIPVNIVIALPYGLYRDAFLRLGRRLGEGSLIRNLCDLMAYVTFQSPVYIGILWSVGATMDQIVTAVTSNILISCGLGVVYGHFLDICRRWFRVPGYYHA